MNDLQHLRAFMFQRFTLCKSRQKPVLSRLFTLPAPILLVVCLVANASLSNAQDLDSTLPANVSLAHFAQIDRAVYVGSKPRSDQDFQFLQSRKIRYIVNARFLPWLSGSEKRKANRYGMTLLTFPMNASPIPPSERHINQILFTLRDKQFQPVYVHCVLGRDRTNLISGLYKIYFLGVPKPEALQEMKQSGFYSWWFVRGLKVYFDKYASRSPIGSRRP